MLRDGGLVKRAIFLATAALLVMLIVVPMALAQGGTTQSTFNEHLNPCERIAKAVDKRPLSRKEIRIRNSGVCNQGRATSSASASPVSVPLGGTGGADILLPAVALLVGSGILTCAILRRR